MHITQSVTEDLIYLGASDRRGRLFENVYPIPEGVSYNSYLLKDEKTALLVGEDVICAALENCMKRSCKSLNKVQLFDVYKGKQIEQGKQSLAFSLWFRSDDHALTDNEVDGFVAKILKNLAKEFEASQR